MKKITRYLLLVLLSFLLIWPIYYFITKRMEKEPSFILSTLENRSIYNYTICSGIVLPKEEVEIKSRVSGILEDIFVKNGDSVYKNQTIAKITVIPNVGELSAARSKIKTTKINFQNQENNYLRNKTLFEKGIISKSNFELIETSYLNIREELDNARRAYSIIKSGDYSNRNQSNTSIVSTIDGIVTLLPTKIGSSVIQNNNFNEGTTIAKIANVKEMIFEGNVKEYEVSKLHKGMPLLINTAINDEAISGHITEISTSGKTIDGMILFEIKSDLVAPNLKNTGFSASAKITIEERIDVSSLKEEWITFTNDSSYVFVHKSDDQFERRFVQLGLSDGIYTEVLSGLNENETIRVYDK